MTFLTALIFALALVFLIFLGLIGFAIIDGKKSHKTAILHTPYHEGAHAVLALHFGCGFDSISVIEDSHSLGRVGVAYNSSIDSASTPEDIVELKEHLVIMMAGYAAETVFFGSVMPPIKDRYGDMGVINKILDSNKFLLAPFNGSRLSYFEDLYRQTQDAVNENHESIRFLAQQVKETPEMSEDEVLAFLEKKGHTFTMEPA